jgi:hypothetical protein
VAPGARAGARSGRTSRERAVRPLRAREDAAARRAAHGARRAAGAGRVAVPAGALDVARPLTAVREAMTAGAVKIACAGRRTRQRTVPGGAVHVARRGRARRRAVSGGTAARAAGARRCLSRRRGPGIGDAGSAVRRRATSWCAARTTARHHQQDRETKARDNSVHDDKSSRGRKRGTWIVSSDGPLSIRDTRGLALVAP